MGEVSFRVVAVARVDRDDANAVLADVEANKKNPMVSVIYGPDAGEHTVTEVVTVECASEADAQAMLEEHLSVVGLKVVADESGKKVTERDGKDVTP